MFINKLKLVNIRSFENTELEFSKSINLLVGNNNSGKSTIIKSIFKLQNLNYIGLDDVRKAADYGRIIIDLVEISDQDRTSLTFNQKDLTYKFPETTKAQVLFGIYTSLIETRNGQEALLVDHNAKYDLDDNDHLKADKNAKDFNPNAFLEFCEMTSNERQKNFIYPFFAKRKTTYYSTNNVGEKESSNISDDFRNITAKVQKISSPSHPKNSQFLQLLDEILGFRLGTIPFRDNQINIGIYVDDNTLIPIENMGEGVVNIIGLIAMLLTEDGKLYLIEELENDIHPRALKKLLGIIIEKSKNNQFIISTHSNIVVKYLGVNQTKIFNTKWLPYKKDVTDQLPTSSIKLLSNDPNDKIQLLQDLGYDSFDFDLYKSYIIFEESSAETLVRDVLIPIFYPDLCTKIKTLAASGADDLPARFHDFLRLFVFIHQTPIYKSKAWVVADGDEAGQRNIGKLRATFPDWSAENFLTFSRENIEDYYPEHFQEEFKAIVNLKDKQEKRERKIAYTKRFQKWIDENPEKAKEELSNSATEILDFLSKVNLALKD